MAPARVAVPPPVEVRRANASDLEILWADGHRSLYESRPLRLACPCASCVDEVTGERRLDPATVPADVHPVQVAAVGRYALHLTWSDGHATGLYSFEILRAACPCPACREAR